MRKIFRLSRTVKVITVKPVRDTAVIQGGSGSLDFHSIQFGPFIKPLTGIRAFFHMSSFFPFQTGGPRLEARPVWLLCRILLMAAAVEKSCQRGHGNSSAEGNDDFLFHRISPPIFMK